jgi:hypothetical protein
VIGDIIIYKDVIHTPPHLSAAFWRRLVKPKPIYYRHIGLGTHLLKLAIKKARQRGVRRICGSLTQEDINNNSHLVKGYQKHGFGILPPSQKNIENAVCGNFLDLE